ncbi:hypothetical protein [Cytobacillus citreus]|nr:hypothetical protein [Cytobacillus citreus]
MMVIVYLNEHRDAAETEQRIRELRGESLFTVIDLTDEDASS